mmetsp:Transcript_33190/g.94374  ORF Transcript_33190/g.94374 Transcript_33190/m.94374 type:complete len:81 (+) Transcript_33190:195-437(+)
MARTSVSLLCLVDVEDAAMADIVSKHRVRAMPTLLYFKNGREVDRMTGVDNSRLQEWIGGRDPPARVPGQGGLFSSCAVM